MAQIVAIVFISLFIILYAIAISIRLDGNTETSGKYNPKTQKMIISIFCMPFYIMIMVQILRAFAYYNPPSILY